MKNKNFFLLTIFILALSVTACSSQGQEDASQPKPVEVLQAEKAKKEQVPAVDFTLKDLNGKNVSLSDYKGKVVLLDFWATWCPPCRVSTPYIVAMQERYKNKGLVVLGISLDEDVEAVPLYAQKAGIQHPILYATQKVSSIYHVQAIPSFFIIDKDGNVSRKYEGFSSDTARDLEREVQSLL